MLNASGSTEAEPYRRTYRKAFGSFVDEGIRSASASGSATFVVVDAFFVSEDPLVSMFGVEDCWRG
jgi:hypothetical protein